MNKEQYVRDGNFAAEGVSVPVVTIRSAKRIQSPFFNFFLALEWLAIIAAAFVIFGAFALEGEARYGQIAVGLVILVVVAGIPALIKNALPCYMLIETYVGNPIRFRVDSAKAIFMESQISQAIEVMKTSG